MLLLCIRTEQKIRKKRASGGFIFKLSVVKRTGNLNTQTLTNTNKTTMKEIAVYACGRDYFSSSGNDEIIASIDQKNIETRTAAPKTPADDMLLEARLSGFDGAEATENGGTPPALPSYHCTTVSEEDSPFQS